MPRNPARALFTDQAPTKPLPTALKRSPPHDPHRLVGSNSNSHQAKAKAQTATTASASTGATKRARRSDTLPQKRNESHSMDPFSFENSTGDQGGNESEEENPDDNFLLAADLPKNAGTVMPFGEDANMDLAGEAAQNDGTKRWIAVVES